jgi:phasin family protein
MDTIRNQADKPARRVPPKEKSLAAASLQATLTKPAIGSPAMHLPSVISPVVPPPNPSEPIMTATQDFTRFFPAFEKIVAFHKGNLEAFVQANTLFAKGAQEISKEYLAHAQEHLQAAATAGQAAFKAKNPQDAFQLNVETAKAGFEKLVATSTKLSEMSVKLATEAFAPVKARLEVAATTFTKTA